MTFFFLIQTHKQNWWQKYEKLYTFCSTGLKSDEIFEAALKTLEVPLEHLKLFSFCKKVWIFISVLLNNTVLNSIENVRRKIMNIPLQRANPSGNDEPQSSCFIHFDFTLKELTNWLFQQVTLMLWDVHIKYAHDTWITIKSPDSRTGYSLNMWRVCKKSCKNIRMNALMKYRVSECIHDMDSIYSVIECICKTEWKRHSAVVNSADPCEISLCDFHSSLHFNILDQTFAYDSK